ncbi:hypothetical protein QOT17_001820 [Balamuthia mandrillaris]
MMKGALASTTWRLLLVVVLACHDRLKVMGGLDSVRWTPPDCSEGVGNCRSDLQVSIHLDKTELSYQRTWEYFVTSSSDPRPIFLQKPFTLKTEVSTTAAVLQLMHTEIIYNTFEDFVPDPFCPYMPKRGRCTETTREAQRKLVLCCQGYARRGVGQHCLKSNLSEAYDVYAVQQVRLPLRVTVSVGESDEDMKELLVMTDTNREYRTSKADGLLQMYSDDDDAYGLLKLPPLVVLMVRSHPSSATKSDWRNWFYVYKASIPKQLGMTEEQWRLVASCDSTRNAHTQTNPVRPEDQFLLLRENRLDKLLSLSMRDMALYDHPSQRLDMAIPRSPEPLQLDLIIRHIPVHFNASR